MPDKTYLTFAHLAQDIGVDSLCKKIGLDGVKDATKWCGHSQQVLWNWAHSDSPVKNTSFSAAILGAKALKAFYEELANE